MTYQRFDNFAIANVSATVRAIQLKLTNRTRFKMRSRRFVAMNLAATATIKYVSGLRFCPCLRGRVDCIFDLRSLLLLQLS